MDENMKNLDDQIKELQKKKLELRKSTKESFDLKKLGEGFNLVDPVGWAKTLSHLVRTLIILGIILGIIFGVGYWKGRKNAPVHVNSNNFIAHVTNGDNKEHTIEVRDGQLLFDGKLVKAGDVPALKPYGIMLKPKLFLGTSGLGAGAKVAQFYNINLDIFAMMPDLIGAGVSYQIHLDKGIKINNLSIGVGMGKHMGGNGDTAIVGYAGWDF